jgi:hypothetical protein
MVVGGVPVGGGVFVPVHRGYVYNAVGNSVVWFNVLDGCVVGSTGMPDRMVKD